MIDLEALKRLAEAATPGPWVNKGTGYNQDAEWWHEVARPWEQWDCDAEGIYARTEADANFIAAFNPQTVLRLIARIRELEAAAQSKFAQASAKSEAFIDEVRERIRRARLD